VIHEFTADRQRPRDRQHSGHRAVEVANDEYLEVFGADGKLRSTTHLDVTTDPYLLGARVDAVRHRAAK
jgi:hypothetical protein